MGKMSEIKATYEIVTPMFISGFDQKEAELRVPSIKGMIRFWWRALNYHNNVETLKDEESKIFGSKDKGKSKVSIKLDNNNFNTSDDDPLFNNLYIKYVGYGLFQNKRKYIKSNNKFTISLSYENDEKGTITNNLLPTLKMLGYLGGLGSRWRRGWGSISLVNLKVDNSDTELPFNKENYINDLKNIIDKISKTNKEYPLKYPCYPAFSNQTKIIISNKNKNRSRWEDEFIDISRLYMNKKTSSEKLKESRSPSEKNKKRMASPLLVHIHKAGNEYYWVCTYLKYNKNCNGKEQLEEEDNSINGFLNELKKNGEEII